MKKALFFISAIILFIACQTQPSGQYIYQPPSMMDDELQVGTLQEVNIDSRQLALGIDMILGGRYKEVHAMLVYKEGKLVLEEYFQGHSYKWDGPKHHGELVQWKQKMLHVIQSDSKSITSACIGIAIDNGFIQSVEQSIFEYLPQYDHLNTDGKNEITIEHLLTMTSGLEANEWTAPYSSIKNPIVALWFPPCNDPITCILEKPLKHVPGTKFSYFGGSQILLGEIIRNATNMDIDSFSTKYLFEPLGIDTSDWAVRFPNGVIESAGGLKLTPRAMIKIGATFLNGGVWNEERIISGKWVQKSATDYPGNHKIKVPGESFGRRGYAYSWWTKEIKIDGNEIATYCAGGWGGQNIIIIPAYNTVVVFTGGNYTTIPPQWKIMAKYVLPAIAS